jgi:pimeloyl-ACP methyl ester carboxylesterase
MEAMLADADEIHTVVSRPGRVETKVLDALLPVIVARRCLGGSVSLRVLEGGAKGAQPLLFLHGRGHAATMWAPVLAELASKRQITAVDLPGFGHSGAPPIRGRKGEEGLAFFAEPIERLLGERSNERPIVVGHSLGGLVALDLASRRPELVRGLVLIDAMGLGPVAKASSRLYLRTGPERLARARGIGRFFTGTRLPDLDARSFDPLSVEALALLREELLSVRGGRPRASKAFDSMVPLIGEPFHLRDRLDQIACDTLLLWGDRDEAFPLPVAIEASTKLRHAKLEVLAAGHSPHVECPTRVANEIDAWVESTWVA